MQLERHDELAVLRMNAGKANAINDALLDGLSAQLDAFEASDARALVITGYERFFSAGLDLVSFIDFDRAAMGAFMQRFDAVMLRVFSTSRPVVAAVNGHAIAGGCVLAMQADWRVLAEGKTRFGINETALGIGLPSTVVEPFRDQLAPDAFARACLGGELFDATTSKDLGLVHEIVAADNVETVALAKARALAAIPTAAYAQVKASLRRPAIAAIKASMASPTDLKAWLDTWYSDDGRRLVSEAVATLKG